MERRAGYCRTAGTSGRSGPGGAGKRVQPVPLIPGMVDRYRRGCEPTWQREDAAAAGDALRRAGELAGDGPAGLLDPAAFSATLVLSWTLPTVKMYRKRMDQATRNDIAAAAAAHRELGTAYDDAVAESLIDRIGAEIDKRVEAKLGARPQSARSLGEAVPPGGHQALLTGTGIGAGITGLVAIIAEHGSKSVIAPMLVIWVIVAVACLGAAAVNRYRNIRRG
jgi:hypothetical protein